MRLCALKSIYAMPRSSSQKLRFVLQSFAFGESNGIFGDRMRACPFWWISHRSRSDVALPSGEADRAAGVVPTPAV